MKAKVLPNFAVVSNMAESKLLEVFIPDELSLTIAAGQLDMTCLQLISQSPFSLYSVYVHGFENPWLINLYYTVLHIFAGKCVSLYSISDS